MRKRKLPTLYYEKKLWKKGYLVVGIDEVGRGALAGPLYVGAVCFYATGPASRYLQSLGINDSKKLTAQKREKLAKIIKKIAFIFSTVAISTAVINRLGIAAATKKAVRIATKHIKNKIGRDKKLFLLLDAFYTKYVRGVGLKNQKAIIHGDEISISIAAASIIAKVERDKLMRKLARRYPKYCFEKNKGYGTKRHIFAIKKYGKTKLHRNLFLRKIL